MIIRLICYLLTRNRINATLNAKGDIEAYVLPCADVKERANTAPSLKAALKEAVPCLFQETSRMRNVFQERAKEVGREQSEKRENVRSKFQKIAASKKIMKKLLTQNNMCVCVFNCSFKQNEHTPDCCSKKHLNFGQGLEFLKFGQGNRNINQQNRTKKQKQL